MASVEVEPTREEAELHGHPGPRQYVFVAIVLAIVTAMEVGIYYIEGLSEAWLVGGLIFFAVIKFALVALYFMHLKFDSKMFMRLFVTGIILAFAVFTIVLLNFFLRPEASTVLRGG